MKKTIYIGIIIVVRDLLSSLLLSNPKFTSNIKSKKVCVCMHVYMYVRIYVCMSNKLSLKVVPGV